MIYLVKSTPILIAILAVIAILLFVILKFMRDKRKSMGCNKKCYTCPKSAMCDRVDGSENEINGHIYKEKQEQIKSKINDEEENEIEKSDVTYM